VSEDGFDILAWKLPPSPNKPIPEKKVLTPGGVEAEKKLLARRKTKFVRLTQDQAISGFRALGTPSALVWYYLHYRVWADGKRTVALTNATLQDWGVSRRIKYRAIQQLAKAGLVRIENQGQRKSLQVTLL
jgi:hypothetical protein